MCSFGDFVAISHVVDLSTALVLKTEVCDGIVAPGYEPEALEILKNKKKGGFIVLLADESFIAPVVEYREVIIYILYISMLYIINYIFNLSLYILYI